MQDRFEKEVQKKMEEMNLSPSAPVWEKIELEIRLEKKKRRPIYWLLFGLLISGGSYLAYELAISSNQLTENHVSVETLRKKHSKPFTTTTTENTTTLSTSNISTTIEKQQIEKGLSETSLTKVDKTKTAKTNGQGFIPEQNTYAIKSKGIKRNVVENKSTINNQLMVTMEKPVVNTAAIGKKEIQPDIQSTKPQVFQITSTENKTPVIIGTATTASILQDSITQPIEPIQPPKSLSDTTTKKKIAQNEKWKKQVNVSVGSSGYASGSLFSTFAVNDAYAYAAPPLSNQGNVPRQPSQINNGFAFAIGFSVTKKLNDHFDLAFGLQYAQYSTTMNVGASNHTDTTFQSSAGSVRTSQYYTNTNNANEYTNRFHVIEAPVTVFYKPFLQVPVLLSAGASYGYLVSTNALSFSSASNLYYQNKDDYVHHLLPVFASIEAELFAKKKVALRLGPIVQYNILKLRKESTGDAQHLFFTGLKSALIF